MTKKYHFIAIGGVGMSGLAKFLLQKGCEVSGSDIAESKYTNKLKEMGAKIYIGHSKTNVPENSTVIVSSAICDTNIELQQAKKLKCKIYHRSDLLEELSNSEKQFIGFCGTHGKTTTSGLTSYLLTKCGYNPSFIVGGMLPELNTNSNYNELGKSFIAELDESDGTLVKYKPDIVVINNLEPDHLDFYKDGLDSIIKTFQEFLANLDSNAKIILNNDNLGNLKLKGYDFITFGLDEAEYMAKNVNLGNGYTTFDVYHNNKLILNSVKIILPGIHNVYNVLGVLAACSEAGYNLSEFLEPLESFNGMGRRFQKMLTINSVPVYDDYAHHPTEISVTLEAMRNFTNRNIVTVFQPHRYSRFKNMWEDFKKALLVSDRLIVTDIYASSEDVIDGVTSEKFVSEIKGAEYYPGTIEDVAKKLLPTINSNDVIIGLGAGTITNLAKYLQKANEELTCKLN